jgi:hypothetical protein
MAEVTRERLEAALREIAAKWRKPHGDCGEDNHEHDCFCSVYDDCAEGLDAALAASVAEPPKTDEALFERCRDIAAEECAKYETSGIDTWTIAQRIINEVRAVAEKAPAPKDKS